MAAKLSFQLDAGKILAKLHRGACETHPNMLFFNTGILNDQKIAPDQVNKAKINFDIVEGGKYELGVIIDQEASIKLGASIEDIVKQLTEYAKKNGGEQGSEKDQGKEQAQGQQQQQPGTKQTDIKQTDAKQADAKAPINQPPQKVNEDATQMNPKHIMSSEDLMDLIVASAVGETTPEQIAAIAAGAPESAIKALQNNQDGVKLFLEHNIPVAHKYLTEYMLVFAGKEQADKITEKDISVTYIPAQFADPYKNPTYKPHKYQIPAETDEKVREMKLKQLEKNANAKEYKLANVCFKIGYELTGAK